jgi:hypothetical protein
MSKTIRIRRCIVRAVAGVAVMAMVMGADEPKKVVDAGGLKFQAPEGWKSIPTDGQMRRAQLKVEPAKGDDYAAELVVFAFPGGAGSVEANITRWQKQFRDADGNPPKIESKTVKIKNVDVTKVETSGHYTPSRFPGRAPEPERDNARLFGAIVITDRVGYFFKMVGPDKTMTANRAIFDELISSIEIDQKNE